MWLMLDLRGNGAAAEQVAELLGFIYAAGLPPLEITDHASIIDRSCFVMDELDVRDRKI
jgi:hypothetical protein